MTLREAIGSAHVINRNHPNACSGRSGYFFCTEGWTYGLSTRSGSGRTLR